MLAVEPTKEHGDRTGIVPEPVLRSGDETQFDLFLGGVGEGAGVDR